MSKKVSNLLAHAKKLDRRLARDLRKAAIYSALDIIKEYNVKNASSTDDQHGIFQNMQSGETVSSARKDFAERKNNAGVPKYDVGPEHEKSKISYTEPARSLSTRYSPDRVGVQAPTKDGIQIDPLTGKEYNWNDGFTTETGDAFPGGGVDQQTNIYFDY